VLEHIEDDFSEIAKASTFLKTGGFLVILAPAHQWLYSEFDRSIGHFRRYNSKSLTAVIPADYTRVVLRYLDSAGIFASLLNRVLLHKTVPTPAQIRFWDKVLVTVSRISDPVLLYLAGKSIIGVWQKN
jgi:hypothetical protein